MNKQYATKHAGFTLIELLMVILIIAATSKIIAVSMEDFAYVARYEKTISRLDAIRKAIIGNPKRTINGQPDISGFVSDMGRLPDNVRELIQRYDCTTPAGASPINCTTPASTPWLDSSNIATVSSVKFGWNGPYLQVSDNPDNEDTYTDGWGKESANDYGWELGFDTPNTDDLTVESFGRDYSNDSTYLDCGTSNYNGDCDTIIIALDWLIDITEGISISFIKPNTPSLTPAPPSSLCTDPTKTTKTTCTTPETWYGGCNTAGFINKGSCTGTWIECSDEVSTDKTTCQGGGGFWYGEGYGCSNQQGIDKASCLALAGTWRSCTDDGTTSSSQLCVLNNEIWYGDSLYTLNSPPFTYNSVSICAKIFYRNSTIQTSESSPIPIVENGSYQTVPFPTFSVNNIPVGINAIGIYKYDGTSCATSTDLYPSDRTQPIPVQFIPHTNLPIINW